MSIPRINIRNKPYSAITPAVYEQIIEMYLLNLGSIQEKINKKKQNKL